MMKNSESDEEELEKTDSEEDIGYKDEDAKDEVALMLQQLPFIL